MALAGASSLHQTVGGSSVRISFVEDFERSLPDRGELLIGLAHLCEIHSVGGVTLKTDPRLGMKTPSMGRIATP